MMTGGTKKCRLSVTEPNLWDGGGRRGHKRSVASNIFRRVLGGLGLMSRNPSEAKALRRAPFITTCVTGTCFGPAQEFLTDTHRKRVYLPLNRLDTSTWKKDNSPVLDDSPVCS